MIRCSFFPPLKRVFGGAVVLSFLWTNTGGLYAEENAFWRERREASRKLSSQGRDRNFALSLSATARDMVSILPGTTAVPIGPLASSPLLQTDLKDPSSQDWANEVLPYGDVGEVYVSFKADAPMVIHVQDAHGIEEAQKNISGILGVLGTRGANVVGIEGASGSFTLNSFRQYPREIVQDVSDFILTKGLIGGPEYAGLTLPHPPTLFGVEEGKRYLDNVAALKEAYKIRPRVREILKTLQSSADRLKETVYSTSLQAYDHHAKEYTAGREKLGTWVRYLTEVCQRGGTARQGLFFPPLTKGDTGEFAFSVNLKASKLFDFPNVRHLLNALDLEGSLDFKQVEADRLHLVDTLVKTLSKEELNTLAARSVSYRSGRVGCGEYHRALKEQCEKNGIQLKRYGLLLPYINYVVLAEAINRKELIDEMGLLEEKAQTRLIETKEQEKLVRVSRRLALLDKLIHHEMSMTDWGRFQKDGGGPLEIQEDLMGLNPSLLNLPILTATDLKPFEDFCSIAVSRNNVLVDHLLAKMETDNIKTAGLVAGGFHTEGITSLLRDKGISYAVVTPKISKIPESSDYLDVLAKDPVPLEQKLAGEKIYLVHAAELADVTLSSQSLIKWLGDLLQRLNDQFQRGTYNKRNVVKEAVKTAQDTRSIMGWWKSVSVPAGPFWPIVETAGLFLGYWAGAYFFPATAFLSIGVGVIPITMGNVLVAFLFATLHRDLWESRTIGEFFSAFVQRFLFFGLSYFLAFDYLSGGAHAPSLIALIDLFTFIGLSGFHWGWNRTLFFLKNKFSRNRLVRALRYMSLNFYSQSEAQKTYPEYRKWLIDVAEIDVEALESRNKNISQYVESLDSERIRHIMSLWTRDHAPDDALSSEITTAGMSEFQKVNLSQNPSHQREAAKTEQLEPGQPRRPVKSPLKIIRKMQLSEHRSALFSVLAELGALGFSGTVTYKVLQQIYMAEFRLYQKDVYVHCQKFVRWFIRTLEPDQYFKRELSMEWLEEFQKKLESSPKLIRLFIKFWNMDHEKHLLFALKILDSPDYKRTPTFKAIQYINEAYSRLTRDKTKKKPSICLDRIRMIPSVKNQDNSRVKINEGLFEECERIIAEFKKTIETAKEPVDAFLSALDGDDRKRFKTELGGLNREGFLLLAQLREFKETETYGILYDILINRGGPPKSSLPLSPSPKRLVKEKLSRTQTRDSTRDPLFLQIVLDMILIGLRFRFNHAFWSIISMYADFSRESGNSSPKALVTLRDNAVNAFGSDLVVAFESAVLDFHHRLTSLDNRARYLVEQTIRWIVEHPGSTPPLDEHENGPTHYLFVNYFLPIFNTMRPPDGTEEITQAVFNTGVLMALKVIKEIRNVRRTDESLPGMAGGTKRFLQRWGGPVGIKSISLAEGIPTGALVPVFVFLPAVLCFGVFWWLGLSPAGTWGGGVSFVLSHYNGVGLGLAGVGVSLWVTWKSLYRWHLKTGVVDALTLKVTNSPTPAMARAAARTAMVSFWGALPGTVVLGLLVLYGTFSGAVWLGMGVFVANAVLSGYLHFWANQEIVIQRRFDDFFAVPERRETFSRVCPETAESLIKNALNARPPVPFRFFLLHPLNAEARWEASWREEVVRGIEKRMTGVADWLRLFNAMPSAGALVGGASARAEHVGMVLDVSRLEEMKDDERTRVVAYQRTLLSRARAGGGGFHLVVTDFSRTSVDRNALLNRVRDVSEELESQLSDDSMKKLVSVVLPSDLPWTEDKQRVDLPELFTAVGVTPAHLTSVELVADRNTVLLGVLADLVVEVNSLMVGDLIDRSLRALMATAESA